MRGTRGRTSQAGFNLVELLMAMALFTIGFLGILALFTTGFGAVSHSKNVTYASNIAQSQLEKIRFSDFNNVASVPRTAVFGAAVVNGTPVTTTFYRTLTVTPNPDNSQKNVVVQVAWEERGFNGADQSQWRSLAFETVLTPSQ